MKNLKHKLEAKNSKAKLIPYPGLSGIRFKKLAEKTSLGEIGDNSLFLHHKWGPRVHLRVLLTDLKIDSRPSDPVEQVCLHCGKCIEACPANALEKNSFNIRRCQERHQDLNSAHSCEICAEVCPIGEVPAEINLS